MLYVRFCINCNKDISNRLHNAIRCVDCGELYKQRKLKQMEQPKRLCASCGCDISDRFKTAKFCKECANKAISEAKKGYNKQYREMLNEKAREKRAKDATERIPAKKGRPKSHKPTPNSVIRAITPVMGELGDLSLGSRKEDRIREITPSPVLAEQPYVVRPDKKTWVFPKTEKRFQQLTSK